LSAVTKGVSDTTGERITQSKRILPSQGGYGARAQLAKAIDDLAISDRVHVLMARARARAPLAELTNTGKICPNHGPLADETFLGLDDRVASGCPDGESGRPQIVLTLIENRNVKGHDFSSKANGLDLNARLS
jgi:hypothetical protein